MQIGRKMFENMHKVHIFEHYNLYSQAT